MTTEFANTKPRPGLRFAKDFAFFDQRSIAHQWRSWRIGNVVSDPKDIEWLTALGAPVEKIEIET
jgi:hypothetical protein